MDLSANFRDTMRNSAERLGFLGFWAWWTGQLRGLVPAGVRNAMQRRMLRPMLVFGADSVALWEPQVSAGAVAYAQTAEIPLAGEPAQVAQAGRSVLDRLARRSGGTARVAVALGPGQVLRKLLTYPAAAAENVQQVLGYDLDRHTPFKSDELYYYAAIVARDTERGTIRVELAAALRPLVDQFRRQVSAWGGEVVAVVPGLPGAPPGAGARRLNLVPDDQRSDRGRLRSWFFWVPAVLFAVLAGGAIAYPLYQKRQQAITLADATEQARQRASAADGVRQQLEQAVADYNFVLARKYAYPSAVAVLETVTHLLPDDTWLTQFELKNTKGKEQHREIMLRGESGNAGRLVSLLEDSKLFEQAAPRSPTTKIQPGPGEIFDLGAHVTPSPLPATVRLADLGPATANAANAGAGAVGSTPGGSVTSAVSAAGAAPAATGVGVPGAGARANPSAPTAPGGAPAASVAGGAAPPHPAAPPSGAARSAPAAAPPPGPGVGAPPRAPGPAAATPPAAAPARTSGQVQ